MKDCGNFTGTSHRVKAKGLASGGIGINSRGKCFMPYLPTISEIFVLILLMSGMQAYGQANIALVATPTTSYVSPWETIDAVNDGFTPAHSNDKSHGAYGNWNNPNSIQWVQYEWDRLFIIDSVEIYWFDDSGGVLTPTFAYIQYYEGGDWADSIPVPCVKDAFNSANIGGILTDKIRVLMLNTHQSTGILEFIVWGKTESGSTDVEAPTAPGTPEVISKTDTSVTIQFTSSTDNIGIEGYEVIMNDSIWKTIIDTTTTVEDLIPDLLYSISINAFDTTGNKTRSEGSIWIYIGPDSLSFNSYSWPAYNPTIDYNFRDEFPALEEPTEDLDDCPEVVGTQSSGWWTFKWGPNKRSVVTEAAITPMLERMNEDFAYFRDSLGWPPDKRAKRGYRSAIYLYGSGLCTDNEDSTALGGWQSSIFYENESWPMVLISYYPVYSFDPSCPYGDREYQMGAVVHEGIHSILADLPGCKQAAWFHEGGNTWLQQEADARRYGDYSSMGWLNGTTFLAPFMPIECYSGWLQDDSFGGPSAEGVNMYSGNQQICTWRNYLGGIQYSNTFPTFIGQVLGPGSVAWIWRYCPKRVLEGMADGLGEAQIRRLIMEYRAKQALVEMHEWEGAIKSLLNSYFKTSVKAEWSPSWLTPEVWIATPYAKTAYDSITGTLTPEYRTTPGWSGANQIPLNVTETGLGDTIIVDFTPLGTNMTCQLCYRATDSSTVYSKPVSSGECGIVLEKEPANGIVIAVITNSDYKYKGDETRKAHYDYRLRLKKAILRKASIYQKWFNYDSEITDVIDPSAIFNYKNNSKHVNIKLYPNPVNQGIFNIVISDVPNSEKTIRIMNLQGEVLYFDTTNKNNFEISTINILKPGIYLLNVQSKEYIKTVRLVVN